MRHDEREQKSREQFDTWSHSYENGFWSKYFNFTYKFVISRVKKFCKNESNILDIGCGTGKFFQEFERATHNKKNLHGIDLSSEMIAIAKKKELKSSSRFEVRSAADLSGITDRYDLVFCLDALHHIPEHASFFQNAINLLKPNGYFILLDLVSDGPFRKTWIPIMKRLFKESDVEFHSMQELDQLAKGAGLKKYSSDLFFYFSVLNIYEKND